MLFHLILHIVTGHIHLAAKDRLERILALGLEFLIDFGTIVRQLFDAVHHSVIGDGHTFHAIGHGLVDQVSHLRLTVKDRVMSVNM